MIPTATRWSSSAALQLTDTPLHRIQGVLPSTMRLAHQSRNRKVEARMSRSVRTIARTCSRVPHGTEETTVPPIERDHQAVRRECAPRRNSTLALSLFPGQHGRAFTSGPAPENPPKRDSVVKVLAIVYEKLGQMSTKRDSRLRVRAIHPLDKSQGLSSPICVRCSGTLPGGQVIPLSS